MTAENLKQIVKRYRVQLNALVQKFEIANKGLVWDTEPCNLFDLYLDCLIQEEKYSNFKSRREYAESKKCEFALQGIFEHFEDVDTRSCIDKELMKLWDALMEEEGI